ncbi:riboflavin biosynthesis protein RibF [Candidatus Bipolaricaulota bacterium]|nr:riboflavin biosynthesis protein RibF [Candidatus Bipolaricaulota bacterium]
MNKRRDGSSPTDGDMALTIGTFDGVHLGHQLLLEVTKNIAKERGIEAVAYTYEEPPKRYLADSGPSLIMNPGKKLDLLRSHIGRVIVGDFPEVKNYSPRRYVEEILVDRLNVDAVVVGNEWRFGKNRSGSHEELRELSEGRFTVHPQNQVKKRGRPVSSTWIRRSIAKGEMELAADLLGRYLSYSGKVVRGNQIGGDIGFPTANMELDPRVVLPKRGNYAAFVDLGDRRLGAAVHVGNRPTFGGSQKHQIEVHLMDYDGNLYDEQLEASLVKYLGQPREYEEKNELKRAIGDYVTEAKKVLKDVSAVN